MKINLSEIYGKTREDVLREFDENASVDLKYHVQNNIGLTDSVFRLESDKYAALFEEAKQYWSKGNIILKDTDAWVAKNLKVGTKAVYTEDGKKKTVKLDTPMRISGENKKFKVYRDSGRKDKDGNIIAKVIKWGDPNLKIKNGDPEAAASFWARHKCDSKAKMNPDTAGFWACYFATIFHKQLNLSSDAPW